MSTKATLYRHMQACMKLFSSSMHRRRNRGAPGARAPPTFCHVLRLVWRSHTLSCIFALVWRWARGKKELLHAQNRKQTAWNCLERGPRYRRECVSAHARMRTIARLCPPNTDAFPTPMQYAISHKVQSVELLCYCLCQQQENRRELQSDQMQLHQDPWQSTEDDWMHSIHCLMC